jgi:hypothetical protein
MLRHTLKQTTYLQKKAKKAKIFQDCLLELCLDDQLYDVCLEGALLYVDVIVL